MLLDINVPIALLWESHDHHVRTSRWLRLRSAFSTCPITQLGFGRICSQPELGFAHSPDRSFKLLRGLLADARHCFIPDDVSCDERILFTEDIRSFKTVTDHYLVALARQHQISLATLDEPLSRAFAHEPGLVELIP